MKTKYIILLFLLCDARRRAMVKKDARGSSKQYLFQDQLVIVIVMWAHTYIL